MNINQNVEKSNDIQLTYQNIEQNEGNIKSSIEENINERYILTTQENTKQRLLDFISVKKKFFFNSFFDHKGTKEFLNSKNEAMKEIELNDNMDNNKIKRKSLKKIKKYEKRKSAGYVLVKEKKFKNAEIKEESLKKKKGAYKGSASSKFCSNMNFGDYRIETSVGNNLDEEEKKWEPYTPQKTHKKKRKSSAKEKDEKNNNKKEKINEDKSIISITTVDSKLFNNNKEYNNFKHLLTKDDEPIFKDILYELDNK